MEQWQKQLIEWQKAHCDGCKFADASKFGTGKPCCTYPGELIIGWGKGCETRREMESCH